MEDNYMHKLSNSKFVDECMIIDVNRYMNNCLHSKFDQLHMHFDKDIGIDM